MASEVNVKVGVREVVGCVWGGVRQQKTDSGSRYTDSEFNYLHQESTLDFPFPLKCTWQFD